MTGRSRIPRFLMSANMEAVRPRIEALLGESPRWTGGKQRLTATQLHRMVVAEGHRVGVTLVKEAVASR